MSISKRHHLPITRIIQETPDTKSYEVAIPSHLIEHFRYKAGQFVTVRVAIDGAIKARCYSISSAPSTVGADHSFLTFTVKRVLGGKVSNWLFERVKVGDVLDIESPAGAFVYQPNAAPLVLIAAGSGITPIFSIVQTALTSSDAPIKLWYANRDTDSIIFLKQFKVLCEQYPARFHMVHWLEILQGLPQIDHLKEWLSQQPTNAHYYLCGPEVLMEMVKSVYRELGLPREQFHQEKFISLPDEDDAPSQSISTSNQPSTSAVSLVSVEVKYEGKTQMVEVSNQEMLLSSLLAQKIPIPYGCMNGACGACMCTLESGEVKMENNQILDQHDLSEGWILACQSRPVSGSLVLKIPD